MKVVQKVLRGGNLRIDYTITNIKLHKFLKFIKFTSLKIS